MRILIQFFLFLLPWKVRRRLLNGIFHYDIDEKAYIGLSILLAAKVTMKSGARMGHFNVFLCQFLDGSEDGIRAACTKGRMIREMAHQL